MCSRNDLIRLRKGLEVALIVTILVAYVVKVGRRDVLRRIRTGCSLAVLLALGIGAQLTNGTYGLSFTSQEAIGGVLSIVATGLVTWMVFWMLARARNLSGQLRCSIDRSLVGSGLGLVVPAPAPRTSTPPRPRRSPLTQPLPNLVLGTPKNARLVPLAAVSAFGLLVLTGCVANAPAGSAGASVTVDSSADAAPSRPRKPPSATSASASRTRATRSRSSTCSPMTACASTARPRTSVRDSPATWSCSWPPANTSPPASPA
ncbi:FTR1 family protein [Cryobacterium sp. TMT2-4]|uniref:FTR1 family protein n=1 Tax=Cryobacterium sp. TMT2-4 TaxID=1259254 RepID=UPI001F546B3D|nr:FTR1 family protein [Cryobacterium sp. TMT2-4]